jgi:hypothetical protein
MKSNNKSLNTVASFLFFIGVLLGMVLFAGLTWANLEANFYFGYNGGAQTKLRLTCPRILTARETGIVTARVTNRSDQTINPGVDVQISSPILTMIRTTPAIEPGKTVRMDWMVNAEDVEYGHLIMVQVYQNEYATLPSAMATCGTLFLNIPGLTGGQIYFSILALSLFSMSAGLGLWLLTARPLLGKTIEQLRGMVLLGAVTLLGILFGSLGSWGLGVLCLAITLLLFLILVGRRLSGAG